MQRILQPGDIEALDHTAFTRVRLPEPNSLYTDRAARLAQLADGNPIADYLRFAARLVRAQGQAAAQLAPLSFTDAAVQQVARAQEHSMPLFPAAEHIDPGWRAVLTQVLDALEKGEKSSTKPVEPLPTAMAGLITRLRGMTVEELDALAHRMVTRLALLQTPSKTTEADELALQPLVLSALQVTYTHRASHLRAADIPYTDPASICPVCAAPPVVSVLRIGGQSAGHRYLHCGLCGTEWHMVRVKCSHCESTEGVRYQGVESQAQEAEAGTEIAHKGAGGKKEQEVVLAETCDHCHGYRKIVNQEKDPLAEPLADDLATLTLDLLMSETPYARAGSNPLLAFAAE
ncbi:formate dehydrogenase accessory protein FdhE [Hylemonella gracilis]|uniref:Protein FdhE homolog n=1 Tax=Hylemonella gracilis ATCC 19624 TaxID=887062 RepID=F3KRG1_9BURK|nr:formate dehydrogenase accessory protein FdhE [Hylemonella gracilis]EGI77651.1 formate dehydrogenase accessory protein FdhE [Hylemonella gracilis ATCC 19624]